MRKPSDAFFIIVSSYIILDLFWCTEFKQKGSHYSKRMFDYSHDSRIKSEEKAIADEKGEKRTFGSHTKDKRIWSSANIREYCCIIWSFKQTKPSPITLRLPLRDKLVKKNNLWPSNLKSQTQLCTSLHSWNLISNFCTISSIRFIRDL